MSENISGAIRSTIPISHFNRGLAGRIFEDVRQSGAKVVMKNNAAECVLLSPEEYLRLMDEISDARLALLAAERMKSFNPASLISADALYDELGVSQKELDGCGEVEIE